MFRKVCLDAGRLKGKNAEEGEMLKIPVGEWRNEGQGKKRKTGKESSLLGIALLFLIADLFFSVPCLCLPGIAVARIKWIVLFLFSGRIVYLYWKNRLTLLDLLCYEGIFLLICLLGWNIHG